MHVLVHPSSLVHCRPKLDHTGKTVWGKKCGVIFFPPFSASFVRPTWPSSKMLLQMIHWVIHPVFLPALHQPDKHEMNPKKLECIKCRLQFGTKQCQKYIIERVLQTISRNHTTTETTTSYVAVKCKSWYTRWKNVIIYLRVSVCVGCAGKMTQNCSTHQCYVSSHADVCRQAKSKVMRHPTHQSLANVAPNKTEADRQSWWIAPPPTPPGH